APDCLEKSGQVVVESSPIANVHPAMHQMTENEIAFRVELQAPVETLDCGFLAIQSRAGAAQVVPRVGQPGIEIDRFAAGSFGGVVAPLRVQDPTQVGIGSRKTGLQLDSLRERSFSLSNPFLFFAQ